MPFFLFKLAAISFSYHLFAKYNSVLTTTVYTVTGSDGCGCVTPTIVTVTVLTCLNPVNLVVNPVFTAGNTGFASSVPSSPLCAANTYTVESNFNLKCPGYPNILDHTTIGIPRNYLIVDRVTTANTTICAGSSTTLTANGSVAYNGQMEQALLPVRVL